MNLDRLLSSVTIHVEPFALCLLDAGWTLRLPEAPVVTFHFVLEGEGVLRGPGREAHMLGRFNLAVVPRDAAHSLECGAKPTQVRSIRGPSQATGIMELQAGDSGAPELRVACGRVRVEFGDSLGLFEHLREVIVADLSPHPQARSAFEAILAEQAHPSPGSEALTAALMNQCLVYLLRDLTAQSQCPLPWLTGLEDPDLARALDAMLETSGASHTVGSLADAASMSRSAFAERFQEAFGHTPMAFLRDVRLRRGAELLQRSTLSIDQIAHRVGFSSRSHFSQVFTARFGVTPASYRAA